LLRPLEEVVDTGGKGKPRSADLVIVCHLDAYRRGHAHEGERCHIVDGGPIPVSLVRQLSRDAFLEAALHDGVKIDTTARFGRRIPRRPPHHAVRHPGSSFTSRLNLDN
jgi:hypothetical protein